MTIHDLKEKGLLLLECISGSKAYGLATEQSDTDIRGVYYLPKELFYGLNYIPQISNETNDETYYELGRFIELLLKNNPNIMELLATPDESILYKHPIMAQLKPELFLSKLCKDTFAGYAMTQVRKARGFKKKIVNPLAKERKSIIDFCFVIEAHNSIPLNDWLNRNDYKQEYCGLSNIAHAKGLYALYYDETCLLNYRGIMNSESSNEVSLSAIPKDEKEKAYLSFNMDGYSTYCKEYREYWDWVDKRNENRYLGNMAHGKDYDAKNMMHTIRLLQVAEEIGREEKINIKRPNRDELLFIKTGQLDYDDLLQMADRLMQQIELAYANTSLPDMPDEAALKKLLVQMREELYG